MHLLLKHNKEKTHRLQMLESINTNKTKTF